MRALVNTPGGDTPVSMQDIEAPRAGPGVFVVKVAAFSVNRGELSLVRFRPEGWRPGQDIAGTVTEAATDGTGPAVGTRVVCIVDGGGWAEYAAVPVPRHAVLADSVSFEQAASLPIAGLTALRTLRSGGHLLGRNVLITGANGGVGRFQIELAAAAGANVTAVTSKLDKAGELQRLGARHVVPDIESAPGQYWLVLESLGGPHLKQAIGKTEPRGTIVIIGNSVGEPTPIGLMDFVGHHGVKLEAFISYLSGFPDDGDLAILVELIARGKLHPSLQVAPWTDLVPSMALLGDRRIDGKLVLTVG